MDPITAVIVTAFLNLAISTGVFLRVQKNIELSFAKQLEAFKAELQKENVEHQIKFSRMYPKTLEVLETFTEKFGGYQMECFNFTHNCLSTFMNNYGPPPKQLQQMSNAIQEQFFICNDYLTKNRIYLADAVVSDLETIVSESSDLTYTVQMLNHMSRSYGNSLSDWFRDYYPTFPFRPEIDLQQKNTHVLYILEMMKKIQDLGNRLEKLYRSVAQVS